MTSNRRDTLRLQRKAPGPQPPQAAHTPQGAAHQPHPEALVFLVQEPTVPKYSGKVMDTTPLLWWGKVRIIMERTQTASFRPAQAYVQIRERLKSFAPERDYIAVAGGDTLAVLLVGTVLAQLGHSYFNYLRFERTRLPDGTRDPATGSYVPIYVPITPATASSEVSF